MPDTAKENRKWARCWLLVPDGFWRTERVPLEVKEGDTVLFAKYAGTEVKLDGEEYMVIKESDVLAIIK